MGCREKKPDQHHILVFGYMDLFFLCKNSKFSIVPIGRFFLLYGAYGQVYARNLPISPPPPGYLAIGPSEAKQKREC